MKIKETIERECCQNKDLVPLPHKTPGAGGVDDYWFCKHCGRHWTYETYMDAAGGNDTRNVPCPWPWETGQ